MTTQSACISHINPFTHITFKSRNLQATQCFFCSPIYASEATWGLASCPRTCGLEKRVIKTPAFRLGDNGSSSWTTAAQNEKLADGLLQNKNYGNLFAKNNWFDFRDTSFELAPKGIINRESTHTETVCLIVWQYNEFIFRQNVFCFEMESLH